MGRWRWRTPNEQVYMCEEFDCEDAGEDHEPESEYLVGNVYGGTVLTWCRKCGRNLFSESVCYEEPDK